MSRRRQPPAAERWPKRYRGHWIDRTPFGELWISAPDGWALTHPSATMTEDQARKEIDNLLNPRRREGTGTKAARKAREAGARRAKAMAEAERKYQEGVALKEQLPRPDPEPIETTRHSRFFVPWWERWERRPFREVQRHPLPPYGRWPAWMRARKRSAAQDVVALRDGGAASDTLPRLEEQLQAMGTQHEQLRDAQAAREFCQAREDVAQQIAYWRKVAAAYDRYRMLPYRSGEEPRPELRELPEAPPLEAIQWDYEKHGEAYDPAALSVAPPESEAAGPGGLVETEGGYPATWNPLRDRPPWVVLRETAQALEAAAKAKGLLAGTRAAIQNEARRVKGLADILERELWERASESWQALQDAQAAGGSKQRFRAIRAARRAAKAAENPATAAKMFKEWHEFGPDRVADVPIPTIGKQTQLVLLGNLDRIDYRSPKWGRRRPGRRAVKPYTHRSTGKPWVMTTARGDVLLIWDPTGGLRATADGIVN